MSLRERDTRIADENGQAGKTAGLDPDSSNVDAVYRLLREAILTGQLRAGSRLSQVQLATQFDMSRGPLREALRLLERDLLISTEHRRMVRVASVSFSDLDQLYALRIVDEALAVRISAVKMSDNELAGLRTHLSTMEACAERQDWDAWDLEHRKFHLGLYVGAGDRLIRVIADLFDHAERYRRIYRSEEPRAAVVADREHRNIVEACAARDASRASALLARHLARTALTLFARTAPEHEPALVRAATQLVAQSDAAQDEPIGPL